MSTTHCPIAAILQSSADDRQSKVSRMDVLLENGMSSFESTPAFYLDSEDVVKFRHEGDIDKTPPVLYLGDMKDEGKILVYYSSSGSGKTSELVGSSASRGSDLAIILRVSDPDQSSYAQFQAQAEFNIGEPDDGSGNLLNPEILDGSQPQGLSNAAVYRPRLVNSQAADRAIREALEKALQEEREKRLFRNLAKASKAAGRKVKLVLAVDEASSCPRVIRGILRFPKQIKGSLDDLLSELNDEEQIDASKHFDLKISIAGTGVASSTIGSLPENFCVLKPYHEDNFEAIINHKLRLEPLLLDVPWSPHQEEILDLDTISSELPVLASLVANGRLASITLAQLRKCATSNEEVKESVLASRIVNAFLESNGLARIAKNEERKLIVAASALAVHFFAKRKDFMLSVPSERQDVAEFAMKMDFFPLSTGVLVKEMVSTYGLLEPSCEVDSSHLGQSIFTPLEMSIPQQLVAIFMMGLDLESMLDPTWFGFEFMSTHFIKCAIAASAAVRQEERPSVCDALRCLGFISDDATSAKVMQDWRELSNWEAVFSESAIKSPYYTRTRQLQVGLKIVDNTNYGELLQLEEKLSKAIKGTYAPSQSRGKVPPIAFINEGNSPLFDGGVTFHAVHRAAKESGEVGRACRVTIMNQAKDYHGDSKIDATKLNVHARRVDNSLLNWVFGEKRLLCVSSTSSSVVASGRAKERHYFPYCVNRSDLLAPLLSSLKDQRWLKTRTKKYTRLYDHGGEERPDAQFDDKKRAGTVGRPDAQKRERDDAESLKLEDQQRKRRVE